MADINFKPLFDYLDDKFAEVNGRLDTLEAGQRILQTSVDNLAKMVKDFHEEMIVTRKRLDILEEWARKVSAKVGIPLPF